MVNIPLTVGIEEEYQIVDPETRELTSYVQQLMNHGRVILGSQLKQEFMQSQIEVGSHVCRNVQEARQEIIRLRKTVSSVAEEHGRAIVAAGTHPFSRWQDQKFSEGERYDDLQNSMQDAARRMLIFGMHVHVGFGKDKVSRELVVDILNQLRYFLPHLLALSASSPFWIGRDTGMQSYRSLVFENMPRTGIPPVFGSFAEYDSYVETLATVGSLGKDNTQKPSGEMGAKDPTKIWWDARPHPNWGTLEVRVADMCTTVDECMCIAATVQSLVAKLMRLRNQNLSWRIYPSHMIKENKWRAVRYGINGNLIDFGIEDEVPMRFLARELVDFLDDVLDDLGTREDVEHILKVVEHGTSADRQVATYRRVHNETQDQQQALHAVVDQLIKETRQGWYQSTASS
jgi:glutamate---cysteine ligase / carboxylate-amine ligase